MYVVLVKNKYSNVLRNGGRDHRIYTYRDDDFDA